MQIRELELVFEELNDVKKIILNTSRLLKKYSDDCALQNDLLIFNNRKKELLDEINNSKKFLHSVIFKKQ